MSVHHTRVLIEQLQAYGTTVSLSIEEVKYLNDQWLKIINIANLVYDNTTFYYQYS
jgi:hypothetical protein